MSVRNRSLMVLPSSACAGSTSVWIAARSQLVILSAGRSKLSTLSLPFLYNSFLPIHLIIYLDKYYTRMVTSSLIVSHHPRRSVPYPANLLFHYPPASLFSNSFPHNLLSDPHPLNPVVSMFYENGGGSPVLLCHPEQSEGSAFSSLLVRCFFTSLLQSSERFNHVPQNQHFS